MGNRKRNTSPRTTRMEKREKFGRFRNNTFEKDISIVGYITPKTVEKWGLDARGFSKTHNVYVGVRKNKNLCYLQPLNVPRPVDYSRYYR